MSAAPVRFASGGRGYDTRNCASVTKEAAMEKLIWSEREFQTFFMSNIKRISDAHIISRESHNTTQQSSVSTVTMVSFCKRAVQDEVGSL